MSEEFGIKGLGKWACCPKCGKCSLLDDRGLPIHVKEYVSEAVCCSSCRVVFKFSVRYMLPFGRTVYETIG